MNDRRVIFSAHSFAASPENPTECARCGRRAHVHLDALALDDQLREWRETYEPREDER
jgi:hypothetical protein